MPDVDVSWTALSPIELVEKRMLEVEIGTVVKELTICWKDVSEINAFDVELNFWVVAEKT